MKIKRAETCWNVEMPYKEKGEQYNNFAESCCRNHSKFSKPIYNFDLSAFHLVRGFGIFNPRSSICPRLSWRRLKAGSRCSLGHKWGSTKFQKNIYCKERETSLFSDLQTKYLNIVSSAIIVAISSNYCRSYPQSIHRHRHIWHLKN